MARRGCGSACTAIAENRLINRGFGSAIFGDGQHRLPLFVFVHSHQNERPKILGAFYGFTSHIQIKLPVKDPSEKLKMNKMFMSKF